MSNFNSRFFLTVLMLSMFIFSYSIRSNLFLKFRNYQNENFDDTNDDELGGSLLDAVAPSSSSDSDFFDDPVTTQNTNLVNDLNLTSVINDVNQPVVQDQNLAQAFNGTSANNTSLNETENQNVKGANVTQTEIEKKGNEALNNNTSEVNDLVANNITINNTNNNLYGNLSPSTSRNALKRQTTINSTSSIIPNEIQTCNTSNIHAPYPLPETTNMRFVSVISLLIFGFSFLVIRLLISVFKNKEKNFFMSGLKDLAKQTLLYFISLSILIALYTYGVLDSIHINWEFFIAGLAIFGIVWILFCISILCFCLMATFKWKELELNTKDSFRKYENIADKVYQQNIDASEIFELYEYLILKVYFCIPFFPIFKASTIRREFKFHVYLNFCLLQKLRLFFKLSWTCWIITIFSIFIWSIFVAPMGVNFITIFTMCIPILGLLIGFALLSYMKRIYRRVVHEVNKNNYLSFTDVEFNQNFAFENFKEYPIYLDEVFQRDQNAKIPKMNFHENFHSRTPSLYEDQIVFGATGFSLLINILQSIGFVFIIWTILIFCKHFNEIINHYGYIALVFIIPSIICYFVIYTYLISISLRWYTIISSIEMKRNDKCIKKTINYQLKSAAEISNSIFLIFKRLYFDIRINKKERDNFNSLGKVVCQNLVHINYTRFKRITEDLNVRKMGEKYPIKVDTELRPFLKSCGMKTSDKDIEFMLHLVENYSEKNDTITLEQLYDIWGAHIHFSTLPPEEIVDFVFDEYFKRREDLEPVMKGDSDGMNMEKVEHFLDFYVEYFSQEQVQFIKEETNYLGKNFSRDAFVQMLLATRRYFPN